MNKKIIYFISVFTITLMTTAQQVTTLAGSSVGFADGTATLAMFNGPYGVATDTAGNIYIGDRFNNKIRKITPEGLVTTLAGSTQGFADGPGATAQFNYPRGVATDAAGNVYVADAGNDKIRKITPDGVVSTLAGSTQGSADGIGAAAQFNDPGGVATDALGNVYVADQYNNKIRKITPAGEVSTFAGSTQGFANGTGAAAQFNLPNGVATDASGNIYVGDTFNNLIRKITPLGEVSTLAGSTQGFADGIGASAQFNLPVRLAIDTAGNVYVADAGNDKIRKITPDGIVNTFAGSTQGFEDGPGDEAMFYNPIAVAIDATGNIYVADRGNNVIRKITQLLNVSQNDITSKMTMYPNPVKTVLTLKSEKNYVVDKIHITDLSGKIVLKQTQNNNAINVESLTKGLYILEVYSQSKKIVNKFIKE
jgi:sugar lactone lactonase YvrE